MSNPLYGERFDHGHLIAHQVLPPVSVSMFPRPRRARVTAATYGGDVVTVVADVVARSGEWLCVAQPDGETTWNVWVHRDCCVPV